MFSRYDGTEDYERSPTGSRLGLFSQNADKGCKNGKRLLPPG